MFTGIVEGTGKVISIRHQATGVRLVLEVGALGHGLKLGDSLAVNGCCLTVVGIHGSGRTRRVDLDLLNETWTRTNLQFSREGSRVNLERSAKVGDRVHGHFVSGHVDGLGQVARWEQEGKDWVLEITAAPSILSQVAFKGSIAVDGISLTVAAVTESGFRLWIIPHTRAVTTLGDREVGHAVNLETDILAKYVQRSLAYATAGSARSSPGKRPRTGPKKPVRGGR